MKRIIFFALTTIFQCNYLIGQEAKEIDMVITINQEVASTVQGLSLKLEDKEGNSSTIYPEYHPGSLMFKKSDYEVLMSSENSSIRFKFYQLGNYKKKEIQHDYSINFHKEWFKENFIVLNIYNLHNRKYKRSRKPIQNNAKYSVSMDFGHYGILDLNNESEYKIPKYH